jgi:protein-disulfide isomerase
MVTKYLYNAALFEKILQEQPRHSLPEDRYSIILGSRGAENKVTIVLNPFCAHCAETYEEICEIADQMVNFELKILFATNESPGSEEISVIKDMLSIHRTRGPEVSTALRSWFSFPNYKRWSRGCQISFHEEIIDELLAEQQAWCKRENIVSTPTILVNGYELPEAYAIESFPGLLN